MSEQIAFCSFFYRSSDEWWINRWNSIGDSNTKEEEAGISKYQRLKSLIKRN